jgi:hypothetical protein
MVTPLQARRGRLVAIHLTIGKIQRTFLRYTFYAFAAFAVWIWDKYLISNMIIVTIPMVISKKGKKN